MERAKLAEFGFWAIGVMAIVYDIFDISLALGEFKFREFDFSPSGTLFLVLCLFSFHFGSFRVLKREIADLKSGDADESTATQDSE
jgi:hypothetical protein